MARAIRYNSLQIPELAATPDAVVPHFKTMRRLRLPGILIPDIGIDATTAMDTLGVIFTACDIKINRTMPPIHSQEGRGDQPLHIDSIPYDDSSVGMVVQRPEVGSADVLLAKLADPFCAELRERNKDEALEDYNYDLPPGTEALLDEGFVDPDVLHPDVYLGSVAAGGAIMFTFGGPNPIAHRFSTTTPERRAQGYIVPFTRL